jgi:DNA glycosylase AlkZ-like
MLSGRALNRALLARQLLLRRSDHTVLAALTHLVGLQAQTPNAPYLALWSRLTDFDPNLLTELINERQVVRIALMRGTIHSVTDSDCLELRPHFDAVLARALQGSFGKHLKGLDLKQVEAAARKLLQKQPLTFNELGKLLEKRWPSRDPGALGNTVRALVPLVQIPPRGTWGAGGLATHVPAEAWLGRPLCAAPALDRMIHRYLAAFGPASVRDVQSWSGLTGLGPILESIRANLSTFIDEERNELFDLPDAPRPDPDTPAPPRFLPVFDNVLLAHADRRRILSEAHRKMLFGTAALLEGTILMDGVVGAKWKIVQQRERVVLTVEPFASLRSRDCAAISDEGTALLSFALPAAEAREIRFAKPSG